MFHELNDEELRMFGLTICRARDRIFSIAWTSGNKMAYLNTARDMHWLVDEIYGEVASRLWKDR
jgi:hypothetical protein